MGEKLYKGLLILLFAFIIGVFFQFSVEERSVAEHEFVFKPACPPFIVDSSSWVDSVFQKLKPAERIAQLFMVPAYPNHGKSDVQRVSRLIKKYKVGGVIFFQGDPQEVARLARYYQSISKVPLLIAIDGEWGLSMRLKNTLVYPRQLMLGAITDDEVIYQMGRDIGKQLCMLGIHVNFAPVVDVNNNPDNPVINSRSFGEDRDNVARKGVLYMRGMQDEGILAVAKHFPGHGDTNLDSHHALPSIPHNLNRLDSIELHPFKVLIESGVAGVMSAHLQVPALDSGMMPASVSVRIVDSLLKQQMKFKGLIFTDAMNMRGIADQLTPMEANILALNAGNDILLMPHESEKTISELRKMFKESEEFEAEINERCRKILKAKNWAVVPELQSEKIPEDVIVDALNNPRFELIRRKLIEKSLTVVSNNNSILPLKGLDTLHIASVSIGSDQGNEFQNTLSLYTKVDHFNVSRDSDTLIFQSLLDTLDNYNLVLLAIHGTAYWGAKQFGINNNLIDLSNRIINTQATIVTAFVNPYLLSKVSSLGKEQGLVVAYENDETTQSIAAQLIFGAVSSNGRLPVSINSNYVAGKGMKTNATQRLKYTIPAEAGINAEKLLKIDSIIYDAINKKAMPGCQVLAARNGKVFFNKSYGYHTYRKRQAVDNDNIYDIASLTKIAATVPAIMHLDEVGALSLRDPLTEHLLELDTTNKLKMRIDDVLLHQAGLKAWIPFYYSYLEPVYPNQEFARTRYSKQYPFQIGKHFFVNKHTRYAESSFSRKQEGVFQKEIARSLYMNPVLIDSIYLAIYASELDKRGKYKYSDLGFILFAQMIERITDTPLNEFVDSLFYARLGATTLGYLPLNEFPLERIAPTENDLVFRKQIVQGYVHDPAAAMLGGVSGHAGLFSNANDLAKYMQMLLNEGTYGDEYFLDKRVIKEYTSCVECRNGNRRGLGFDKPEPDTSKNGPAIPEISLDSYGHSGFTGTLTWVDPSTGMLYIFLSNRVFPDAVNNKLAQMDVRTNIMQILYDAMEE